MKTSEAGVDLIKRWHPVRLTAYTCPEHVWHVGYGSSGPNIMRGVLVTIHEADALLRRDLLPIETMVTKAVRAPGQCQFDALVAFAHAIGAATFIQSAVTKHHNMGAFISAANCFALHNRERGKVSKRMADMRADESELYSQ